VRCSVSSKAKSGGNLVYFQCTSWSGTDRADCEKLLDAGVSLIRLRFNTRCLPVRFYVGDISHRAVVPKVCSADPEGYVFVMAALKSTYFF
jgi:hypothetical protein